MKFEPTPLAGCYTITLLPKGDERGWFMRSFSANIFEKETGENLNWVQMNHSFTANKGTIRGMHFQNAPHEETKLVRCIAGAVFDVVVDLRKNSATYLHWFGVELSAANYRQLLIPKGFAHGFQTLEDNSELVYSHSANYTPEAEAGVMYNDPAINIKWPSQVTEISERDQNHLLINN